MLLRRDKRWRRLRTGSGLKSTFIRIRSATCSRIGVVTLLRVKLKIKAQLITKVMLQINTANTLRAIKMNKNIKIIKMNKKIKTIKIRLTSSLKTTPRWHPIAFHRKSSQTFIKTDINPGQKVLKTKNHSLEPNLNENSMNWSNKKTNCKLKAHLWWAEKPT